MQKNSVSIYDIFVLLIISVQFGFKNDYEYRSAQLYGVAFKWWPHIYA